jgi:hypothetical protein
MTLTDKLQTAARRVRAGDEVDLVGLQEQIGLIPREARAKTEQEKRMLLHAVVALKTAIAKQVDTDRKALAKLGMGARGVRGYGALRSNKRSQRVFCKA